MSQKDDSENRKTTKPKPESKNDTKKAKKHCRIHPKVSPHESYWIHENVCVYEYDLIEHEGKPYCLFHLPTNNKDVVLFMVIFEDRLEQITYELKEAEQTGSKWNKKSYNFNYVWFPETIDFANYDFLTYVNFHGATFAKHADFMSAKFSGYASFGETKFLNGVDFAESNFTDGVSFVLTEITGTADFSDARFLGSADFSAAKISGSAKYTWAEFSEHANFNYAKIENADFIFAKFLKQATFDRTKFSGETKFDWAVFSEEACFDKAKFSKTDPTSFMKASFEKNAFFDRARFKNDANFNSVVFGSDANVFFRKTFFAGNADFQQSAAKGNLNFSNLRQGEENKFDFQEAAFEKASRVSFHTVRLQPNWFVNVDARKFVFTNIEWLNTNYKTVKKIRQAKKNKVNIWSWNEIKEACSNPHIRSETNQLKLRGIKNTDKRLLEIACRQLAVNAEENNRYEEASKFRYMAMETRRLENKGRLRKIFNIHWFYKWSSGYGESWRRAFVVLILILFLSGFFYEWFGVFEICNSGKCYDMTDGEGYTYSLFVAALQRPEPKAVGLTKVLVILETIFAPLQAALLALAIRRKFMR